MRTPHLAADSDWMIFAGAPQTALMLATYPPFHAHPLCRPALSTEQNAQLLDRVAKYVPHLRASQPPHAIVHCSRVVSRPLQLRR